MKEQNLVLTYHHFKVPIKLSVVDALIKKEVSRLSRLTGLPGERLLIKYVRKPEEGALAWFSNCIPYALIFNLDSMEKNLITPHQLIETVQHEFAHYVQKIRYGINMDVEGGHGPEFIRACKEVGCSDDRYFCVKTERIFDI